MPKELPPIKLPKGLPGQEVVVTSEETGQAWSIVSTNAAKTRRRLRLPGTYVEPVPPPPAATYTFEDNFVDGSKWAFDSEWGSGGLSTESDLMNGGNVTVANGIIALRVARGATPSGRPWQSAERATKGTFSQLYGIFQARIRYPKGQGFWPAFWLLDATSSGRRPELDIVEAYPFGDTSSRGGGPTQFAMTNHYRDSAGVMQARTLWCKPGIDLTLDFHVFELEWRKDVLISRLDGREMGRLTGNVPAVPMFMILNHVVGGWAGASDSSSPSPADMLVDWVRVQA